MLDFLIIGGGIAGISSAARLSSLGKCLILEREQNLSYHTSGRSAALYEENYGSQSTIALAKASRQDFDNLLSGVLSPRGFMLLCLRGEETQYETDLEHMSLTEISMTEAVDMVPILNQNDVLRAAISKTAQDIDTDMMIQSFARLFRANGGQIETNQTVRSIKKVSDGWQVDTHQDCFMTKTLINAAGAWGDEVAKMANIPEIGLTPMRRSVARIAPPTNLEVRKWPMLFGPGERWYAKPDAGGLIVSLAEETPSAPMDAWAHDIDLAEALARYQDYVTEPVTRPIASWAGLRTFAPDRNLVLGAAKKDSSFIWAVGQGGYGFFTAPAASQFIADVATGQQPNFEPEIISDLNPSRFDA
jgi:D-arginine dehydrogenase